MNRLKCVITGEPVTKLGSCDNIYGPNNYDPDVDGVSTHIGVVHRNTMDTYMDAAIIDTSSIGNRRDDTRYRLWKLTGDLF